jgi:murein DD-endopeptidase MepM/ murein hydrolase activator NlpD
MKKSGLLTVLVILGIVLGILVSGYIRYRSTLTRSARIMLWMRNPEKYPDWTISALERCGNAPFKLPTGGFIGYLWDDSFKLGQRHQGIDIFGGTDPGVTPVYASFDGFLTRQPDWKSSLIIRIPDDPLMHGRQIWLYYTHMADPGGLSYIVDDFPPGTTEKPVHAGDLLGYQGNYSGDPQNPVGVHLHFSITRDDGTGHYLNELKIQNTLDPSPYLGIELNSQKTTDGPFICP